MRSSFEKYKKILTPIAVGGSFCLANKIDVVILTSRVCTAKNALFVYWRDL
jgi:hypothetical protein